MLKGWWKYSLKDGQAQEGTITFTAQPHVYHNAGFPEAARMDCPNERIKAPLKLKPPQLPPDKLRPFPSDSLLDGIVLASIHSCKLPKWFELIHSTCCVASI
jgi:hypothetical protein